MAGDTRAQLFALRISPPRLTRQLVGALAIAVIVLLWWIATSGLGSEDRWISPVILPSPGEVIRSFPSLLNGRQKDRDENGDDRDDDQKFDQGESRSRRVIRRSVKMTGLGR